jgi:hypothetical protein
VSRSPTLNPGAVSCDEGFENATPIDKKQTDSRKRPKRPGCTAILVKRIDLSGIGWKEC